MVVLVQDPKDGPWRSLGIASAQFEAVVRRVLLHAPAWRSESGRASRVEFFAQLFGHEDPQIHRLAYLEMGRAPYSVIRRLGRVVSRAQFATMLEDRKYIEWRPLAILLLAQSQNPEDAEYVWESLKSAQKFQLTTNLAAWASAAIEIDGAKAIAYLEQYYCRQPDCTEEELREVLKAFSLHGTEGALELRERIVAAYRVLLEYHPSLAEFINSDMSDWNRQELAELPQIIEALRAGHDNTTLPVDSVAGSSGQ
jgi:hypothetical protein